MNLKFSRSLWAHQARDIERFEFKNEVALLHDMGTGKTTTAIGWLRCKYVQAQSVLPTLIVSPIATLGNWLEEFERNSPEQVYSRAVILDGGTKKKLGILRDSDARIFITNGESMQQAELAAAIKSKQIKCLVVDEVHRFKNHKSKRLKGLTWISDFTLHRAVLTGTPILNSMMDIWAIWRILDRGESFGLNPFVFREEYFTDRNAAWKGRPNYFPDYAPKPGMEKKITEIIDRKASRVKKSDCLSLPPLIEIVDYVELSAEQSVAYEQMKEELIAYVSSGECVATNALTRVLRLLQILTGYVQVAETEEWNGRHLLRSNPRLDRLKELLEELTPKNKVIVWATFKENYSQIRAVCGALKLEYAELTGETVDRTAELKRFDTDPKCRVMISNPQAGGVGVNMIAASYAIYYSRSFSLGDRLQSEARNYRGGSEKHLKVTLIDLVAKDTLDEDVLEALKRKENFSDSVLDKLKNFR